MSRRVRHCRESARATTVTDPDKRLVEDLHDQVIDADGPDQEWIIDITHRRKRSREALRERPANDFAAK